MINFASPRFERLWPSFILCLCLAIEGGVSFMLLEVAPWLGFAIGLGVFGGVFLSLEVLARKVLAKASVGGGVVSGVFWFAVKVVGPLGLFYYAIARGLPIIFVFAGLAAGLVTVSLILWAFSVFRDDNY